MARPTDECPHCGAEYPRGRLACPECGSDAATGWRDADEIDYQSVDLPDAWPPGPTPARVSRRIVGWWIAAAVALAAAAILALMW